MSILKRRAQERLAGGEVKTALKVAGNNEKALKAFKEAIQENLDLVDKIPSDLAKGSLVESEVNQLIADKAAAAIEAEAKALDKEAAAIEAEAKALDKEAAAKAAAAIEAAAKAAAAKEATAKALAAAKALDKEAAAKAAAAKAVSDKETAAKELSAAKAVAYKEAAAKAVSAAKAAAAKEAAAKALAKAVAYKEAAAIEAADKVLAAAKEAADKAIAAAKEAADKALAAKEAADKVIAKATLAISGTEEDSSKKAVCKLGFSEEIIVSDDLLIERLKGGYDLLSKSLELAKSGSTSENIHKLCVSMKNLSKLQSSKSNVSGDHFDKSIAEVFKAEFTQDSLGRYFDNCKKKGTQGHIEFFEKIDSDMEASISYDIEMVGEISCDNM